MDGESRKEKHGLIARLVRHNAIDVSMIEGASAVVVN